MSKVSSEPLVVMPAALSDARTSASGSTNLAVAFTVSVDALALLVVTAGSYLPLGLDSEYAKAFASALTL